MITAQRGTWGSLNPYRHGWPIDWYLQEYRQPLRAAVARELARIASRALKVPVGGDQVRVSECYRLMGEAVEAWQELLEERGRAPY